MKTGGLGRSGWREVPDRKPGGYIPLEEIADSKTISPEQVVIVRDLINKDAKLSPREEALAARILENLWATGEELSAKEKAAAKRLGLEPPKEEEKSEAPERWGVLERDLKAREEESKRKALAAATSKAKMVFERPLFFHIRENKGKGKRKGWKN